MSHPLDERGQVAPLLALLAVGVGLACLALGRFGADAAREAATQAAADAAALAASAAAGGGGAGEVEARDLAGANATEVVAYEEAAGEVRVRVRDRSGNHEAVARARGDGGLPGSPRASDADGARSASRTGDGSAGATTGASAVQDGGLAPVLRAALDRAGDLLGQPVPITSAYRSPATQRRLWLDRARNPYPVAPPGASVHARGLAVDVPAAVAERLAANAPQAGLCRPYPKADPVHFEPC